jgi:glycerate kinase
MRVLVAPQEYKGSLTAAEAAGIIADGVREALPDADVVMAPVADGGPGLLGVMLRIAGARAMTARVHDPLGRPVDAAWVRLPDGVGVIEMAAASGLVLVAPAERRSLDASTYGTGELIRAALDERCSEVIVGAGGSATTDAGAGALQALGIRLLDAAGDDLPPGGGALLRLHRIDASGRDARIGSVRVRVATDVRNPLCGPNGAARVFAAQKGATPEEIELLESALLRFAEVAARDLGADVLALEGGGAAGGLAAGLAAGLGATIEPGFPLVAAVLGLERLIADCDIVITGEGRLDAQTSSGKAPQGVAEIARRHGRRTVMLAGSVDAGYDVKGSPFDVIELCAPPGMTGEEAMREAPRLLREAACRAMARLAGR